MMNDTRLFSGRNPINGPWYFVNLFKLAVFIAGTRIISEKYIIPQINTAYEMPVSVFINMMYVFYVITLFMLVDRRMYDICGDRDAKGYKFVSTVISLIFLFSACSFLFFTLNLPDGQQVFNMLIYCAIGFFFLIVFVIGFFPGQLTR